ncbi:MAG: hypothetical protein CL607_11905 [Anaerolineaceae bacterium]|nr:hypothetical protein [Anaerolineaceae bacterium]
MPVSVDWLDQPKTILHMKFKGEWTWDEFHASEKQAKLLSKAIEYPTYLLMDFADSMKSVPMGALSHFRSAALTAPANRKAIVIIGPRLIVAQTFVNLLTQLGMTHLNFHITRTYDEAVEFIANQTKIGA